MNLMLTLLSPLTKITVYRLYLFNYMAFSFIIVGFAAILEFCKLALLEENLESSRLHRETVRFDRKLRVPRPNRKSLKACINRYSLPITECLYSSETL